MNQDKYNIVMFAYNEEANIEQSIKSVAESVNENLFKFYIIANGCTDNTAGVVQQIKQNLAFEELELIELQIGDKCNAWNHYVHNVADPVGVHFFVDADVNFSKNCFGQMSQTLSASPEETVVIAGLPLSGRNLAFYRSLVMERSCFFGNLYGLKYSFIQRIREASFRLPVGLNWIDSFLTKAVNTDLQFFKRNLPHRTTWIEGVGYHFDSLSVFKKDDIQLYVSRIARYELGKLQETYLDKMPVEQWPADMVDINKQIAVNFKTLTCELSWFKTMLVKRRLNRLLAKAR